MASPAENRRGIVFMLSAMLLFIGNDTLMKLARETYPVGQAIAVRTIFAAATGLAMVFLLGEGRKLAMAFDRRVLARALVESAVALSFIWSLGLLPIANITAIVMTSPIIIVVLAVLLGIERIGWRRGVAILVAFAGVIVVVRPGPEGFSIAALVALASAVLVGVRDLLTRSIGSQVPSTVISLTTTVVVGVAALGLGLFETWVPVWRIETIYLALAAVLVSIGSIFIVAAFRDTDLGIVSGFRYSVVVYAVVMGWLVWGEVPDGPALAGIALIVGSGLYTMHRARVRPDSNLKIAGGPPA